MILVEIMVYATFALLGFYVLSIIVFMLTGKSLLWRIAQAKYRNFADEAIEAENRNLIRYRNENIDTVFGWIEKGRYGELSNCGEPIYWRDYFLKVKKPIIKAEFKRKKDGNDDVLSARYLGYDEDGVEYVLTDITEVWDLFLHYYVNDKNWNSLRKTVLNSKKEEDFANS